jgi:hypothetical protein
MCAFQHSWVSSRFPVGSVNVLHRRRSAFVDLVGLGIRANASQSQRPPALPCPAWRHFAPNDYLHPPSQTKAASWPISHSPSILTAPICAFISGCPHLHVLVAIPLYTVPRLYLRLGWAASRTSTNVRPQMRDRTPHSTLKHDELTSDARCLRPSSRPRCSTSTVGRKVPYLPASAHSVRKQQLDSQP